MKKISVIIPMCCEEEIVDVCYKRVITVLKSIKDKYDSELIFIDDGSTDSTLELLKNISKKDKNVKIISFSRNFGHQAAVTAGLKEASGDAIIIMDADLQDPPELFPDMIKHWEEGYEVVYGKRIVREGESHFKLFTADLFYSTLNKISDTNIPKNTGDFRLVDRKVVDVINSLPEHNKFLRGLFSWVGFNQYELEYKREERAGGKSKYPLNKMIKLATDGFFSFSAKPLRFVGYLGVFSIIISLLLLIYTVLSFFLKSPSKITPGWASIMTTICFFSGAILISLSMIGEYVSRIYDEAKGRPQYIISDKINFHD